MIKAIIFDFGGVLTVKQHLHEFSEIYAPKFGADIKEFDRVLHENWLQARINGINSKVFWKNLSSFLKTDEKELRKDFIEFFGFRPEVLEFIQEIKKKKYKLGMLSNQIEDWLEEHIQNHNLNKIFDVIVTSYGSRLAKPDVAIYLKALKELSCKAEECIFVDDLIKNVEAANKLGINGILFESLEQLKKELKVLGVK